MYLFLLFSGDRTLNGSGTGLHGHKLPDKSLPKIDYRSIGKFYHHPDDSLLVNPKRFLRGSWVHLRRVHPRHSYVFGLPDCQTDKPFLHLILPLCSVETAPYEQVGVASVPN